MLEIRAYNKDEDAVLLMFDQTDFSNKKLSEVFKFLWEISVESNTILSKDSKYYFYIGSNADVIDDEYLFELKRKPRGQWELSSELAYKLMDYKARGVLYLSLIDENYKIVTIDGKRYITRIKLEFDGNYGKLYDQLSSDLKKSITTNNPVQNQHTFDKVVSGAIWPIEYYEKIVAVYPTLLSKTNKYFIKLKEGIELCNTTVGIKPRLTKNIPINQLMLFMFRELLHQYFIVSESLQKDIEFAKNRLGRNNIDSFEKKQFNKIVESHTIYLERINKLKQDFVQRYTKLENSGVMLPRLNVLLHFKEITYDKELASIVKSIYAVLSTLGYHELNAIEHSVEPYNQLYQRWVYLKVEEALLKIGCKIKNKKDSTTFVPIPESSEFISDFFDVDKIVLNYEKQYAIEKPEGFGVIKNKYLNDFIRNKSKPDISIELFQFESKFPLIITIDATISNNSNHIREKQSYLNNIVYYKNKNNKQDIVCASWVFHPAGKENDIKINDEIGDFVLNEKTSFELPIFIKNLITFSLTTNNKW
jgi:hypothetical protein